MPKEKVEKCKASSETTKIVIYESSDLHNERNTLFQAVEYREVEEEGISNVEITFYQLDALAEINFNCTCAKVTPGGNKVELQEKSVVILDLGVQHFGEKVFDENTKCENPPQPSEIKLYPAGSSRIVFRPPQTERMQKNYIQLSGSEAVKQIIEILGWEIIVDERAKHALLNKVVEQLRTVFGNTKIPADYNKAMDEIAHTLNKPLEGEVTALEPIRGLILSPSEKANWKTPKNLNLPNYSKRDRDFDSPLFTLKPNIHGRKTIRAIRSELLNYNPDATSRFPNGGEELIEGYSLTKSNHLDLIAQNSVYGMPAIRPLMEEEDSNDKKPTTPNSGVNAPRPDVVDVSKILEEKELGFLKSYSADKLPGIAVPQPFKDAELIYSALGAIFEGEWLGEPPTYLGDPAGGDAELKLNLEKLRYKTWLGRDSEVVAVEKGYLYPLGIRAALVKVVYRRILREPVSSDLTGIDPQSYSYLAEREFIVVRNKKKHFPGPYHPNDARDMPASTIEIKTVVTPDLKNTTEKLPLYYNGERIEIDAFWPIIGGSKAPKNTSKEYTPFLFEWATEDAPSVKGQLLFVKNSSVQSREHLRALKHAYDPESGPDSSDKEKNEKEIRDRKAIFDGSRQRYAPEASTTMGYTSFDTECWKLGVRGREGFNSHDLQGYALDGRLVGADQPPFFPYVAKAKVSIQTLNNMMGTPHKMVNVKYFDGYLENGFYDFEKNGSENHKNKSNIYMQLDDFDLKLGSDKADRTGGMASPAINVAAISRDIGLIGGNSATAETLGELSFQNAIDNKFDASEFMPKGKLLGVVEFSTLLSGLGGELSKAAPKLIENAGFALNEEALELFLPFIEQVRNILYGENGNTGVIADLQIGIGNVDYALSKNTLSFPWFYKDLYVSLVPFTGELSITKRLFGKIEREWTTPEILDELNEIIGTKKTPNSEEAIQIYNWCVALLESIEDFIHDPVPNRLSSILNEITTIIHSDYLGEVRKLVTSVTSEVTNNLQEFIKTVVCQAITEKHSKSLLGEGSLECPLDVNRVLVGLKKGLYRDLITDHRTLGLNDLAWLSSSSILGKKEDLEADIKVFIVNAVKVVEDLLKAKDCANEKQDIQCPDAQLEIAESLALAVINATKISNSDNSINGLLSAFNDVKVNMGKLPEDLNNILRDFIGYIKAKDDDDLSDILETLSKEIIDQDLAALTNSRFDRHYFRFKQLTGDFSEILVKSALDVIRQPLNTYETFILKSTKDPESWCEELNKTIKLYAGDALSPINDIEDFLDKIKTEATKLQESGNGDKLTGHASHIIGQIKHTLTLIDPLKESQNHICDSGFDVCDEVVKKVNIINSFIQIKREISDSMINISRACLKISKASQQQSIMGDPLTLIVENVTKILKGISIASAHEQTKLTKFVETLDLLLKNNSLPANSNLKLKIDTIVNKLQEATKNLRETLENIKGNANNLQNSITEIEDYYAEFDHAIASILCSSVAFSEELINVTKSQTADALRKASGGVVNSLYIPAIATLNALIELLRTDNRVDLKQIFFKNPADLENLLTAIENERDDLVLFSSPDEYLINILALLSVYDNNEGALQKLLGHFRYLCDLDLKQHLGALIEQQLEELREEVEKLKKELIPTQLSTQYEWSTKLQKENSKGCDDSEETDKNDDEDKRFIEFTEFLKNIPELTLPSGEQKQAHLYISGKFGFDIVEENPTSDVKGYLAPFKLNLIPGFDMATICFGTGSFLSINGSSPDFKLDVTNVELGSQLGFIQKLQDWLGPNGNGFYLEPFSNDGGGIIAGYQYSTDLIPLGGLMLIDLSFDVAAKIFFSGGDAQFIFKLADPRRPFMISAPPYGGGGWLKMVAKGDGIEKFAMSFLYGGVTPIKFGPLRGTGRVVAGIGVMTEGNKSSIVAIFEAVGEGAVACFSISIGIRITLTQHSGGTLFGEAILHFSFKAGIITITYKIHATYQIKSGNENSLSALKTKELESCDQNEKNYSTNIPKKREYWRDYNSYFCSDFRQGD